MPCGPELGGQKYELVPSNLRVLFTEWDWLRGESLPCHAEAHDQQLLRCWAKRSTRDFDPADLVGSIARRANDMEDHGPTNFSSGDVSATVYDWTVHTFARYGL